MEILVNIIGTIALKYIIGAIALIGIVVLIYRQFTYREPVVPQYLEEWMMLPKEEVDIKPE